MPENPLDLVLSLAIGDDDQDHDQIPDLLDPPLKADEGEIRPGQANGAVKKKNENPFVRLNQFRKVKPALEQDE